LQVVQTTDTLSTTYAVKAQNRGMEERLGKNNITCASHALCIDYIYVEIQKALTIWKP